MALLSSKSSGNPDDVGRKGRICTRESNDILKHRRTVT